MEELPISERVKGDVRLNFEKEKEVSVKRKKLPRTNSFDSQQKICICNGFQVYLQEFSKNLILTL